MAIGEEAFVACYRRIERPLHNVLYRLLWHGQDCQDLMHDAFLRVWNRRDTVDPGRVDALVYATAMNLAKNRLRWRALWRWDGVDAAEAVAGDEPQAAALQATLRNALATLSVDMRQVILLSEIAGFGTAEIARILDIPAGTVGSRKHHAMRRLRASLGTADE